MDLDVLFTLCYLMICACIVYPPTEFQTAGITIQAIFGRILGSEDEQFILYHLKRSSLTLLIFSMLPLLYLQCLCLFCYEELSIFSLLFNKSLYWQIYFTTSIALPILAVLQVLLWARDKWENHPIMVNLAKFATDTETVHSIMSNVNCEYRRIEKICLRTNPITKVVATENWIIKIELFTVHFAQQSDSFLTVKQADTHHLSHQHGNDTTVQYINIEVKSSRENVHPFNVRINSMDFKDFQDRCANPIMIHPSVSFHKTLMDKFVDTFKEAVKNNPTYQSDEQLEHCIGCFQAVPSVKIQKHCEDDGEENCTTCYCRPMWCIECMAKWFASRQDEEQLATWLSSKCTCPMCRARFCILDVCMINNQD